MKRMRWVQAGVALAASAIMVVGAAGSASASGPDVSVDKSWGFSMFFTYGDQLTVYDRSADDHSVHAKIQHLACANVTCDGRVWRDLRDDCIDTTTTGTGGSEIKTCNYDVTENLDVRVCEARFQDGVINGVWYCSGQTKS
ncbi:hypothetical protein ACIBSW_38155 [Actinoplanes sp. NPDC049668]|uniref:hypothetical protein n=1 Tax=unclassified Actinoplanes TaxID=2626549 RepID=UPI0033B3CFF2